MRSSRCATLAAMNFPISMSHSSNSAVVTTSMSVTYELQSVKTLSAGSDVGRFRPALLPQPRQVPREQHPLRLVARLLGRVLALDRVSLSVVSFLILVTPYLQTIEGGE
jgi:hypothetical protein